MPNRAAYSNQHDEEGDEGTNRGVAKNRRNRKSRKHREVWTSMITQGSALLSIVQQQANRPPHNYSSADNAMITQGTNSRGENLAPIPVNHPGANVSDICERKAERVHSVLPGVYAEHVTRPTDALYEEEEIDPDTAKGEQNFVEDKAVEVDETGIFQMEPESYGSPATMTERVALEENEIWNIVDHDKINPPHGSESHPTSRSYLRKSILRRLRIKVTMSNFIGVLTVYGKTRITLAQYDHLSFVMSLLAGCA